MNEPTHWFTRRNIWPDNLKPTNRRAPFSLMTSLICDDLCGYWKWQFWIGKSVKIIYKWLWVVCSFLRILTDQAVPAVSGVPGRGYLVIKSCGALSLKVVPLGSWTALSTESMGVVCPQWPCYKIWFLIFCFFDFWTVIVDFWLQNLKASRFSCSPNCERREKNVPRTTLRNIALVVLLSRRIIGQIDAGAAYPWANLTWRGWNTFCIHYIPFEMQHNGLLHTIIYTV